MISAMLRFTWLLFAFLAARVAVANQCDVMREMVEARLSGITDTYETRLVDPRCEFVMTQIARSAEPYRQGRVISRKAELDTQFSNLRPKDLKLLWKRVLEIGAELRVIDTGYSSGGFTVLPSGKPLLVLDRATIKVTLDHELGHLEHAVEIADFLQRDQSLDRSQAFQKAATFLMTPEGTLESEARAVRAELDAAVTEINEVGASPYMLVGSMNYPALQGMLRAAQLQDLMNSPHVKPKAKAREAARAAMTLSDLLGNAIVQQTFKARTVLGLRSRPSTLQDFFPSIPPEFVYKSEGGPQVARTILAKANAVNPL